MSKDQTKSGQVDKVVLQGELCVYERNQSLTI